ncbi:MAG: hypothetical protein N3A38_15330, partial [Planctomycetota bacterium]|nr:hypothetical protein [Planctomycetota bacterium]
QVYITITGGMKRVALYCLDWDTSTRRQDVEFRDASTGAMFHRVPITTSFNGGMYVIFNMQGSVRVRFNRTAGSNAVLSAIFFDPPTASPPDPDSFRLYSYDAATRILTISGIKDPNFLSAKTFAVKLKGQTVNFGSRPAWQPNTNYSIDDEVIPTAPSRFYYKAISDAGSSGGSEPTWPEVPGFTVDDSGITWQCYEAPRSGLRHASATRSDGTPVNYLRGDRDVNTPSSWGLNPLYGSIAAASPGDPPKITWVGNYGYRLGNYDPSTGAYPQTYGAVTDQIEVRFNRPIDSFSARNAGYWSLTVGGTPVDVKSCSVLFDDKACNASSSGPTRLWLVGVDLRGYANGTPITVTCESARVLAQNGDPIVTPNNTCNGTLVTATSSTNRPRWAVADSSGAPSYTGNMTIHFGPGPRLDPVTAENPANYTVQCSTLPTGSGDAVSGPSYVVYDQESNTVRLFGLTRTSASYWTPGNYARVTVSSNVRTDQGQSAAGGLGDHSQSQPIILIGRSNSYVPSQSGGNARSFYDPGDRKTARLAACAPASGAPGVNAAGGVLRLTSAGGSTNWVALRATDGSGGPASFLFNNTTFEGLDYEVDIHGPPAAGTYTRMYFLGGNASGTGAHPANYNGPALELRALYNSGVLSFQVRGKSSGTGEPVALAWSSGPTTPAFVSGAKLHFRVDATNWYVFYNNASVGTGTHTLAASFASSGAYAYLMYEGAGTASSTGLYDDIYVSRRIRSAANGNWSAAATWNPPLVPDEYDNVSIRNSVALTEIGSCRNLALEGVQSLTVPLVEVDNDISTMYFVLSRNRIM